MFWLQGGCQRKGCSELLAGRILLRQEQILGVLLILAVFRIKLAPGAAALRYGSASSH